VRRFTESTRERAAEMCTGQHRGRSHLIDGQFAGVLRVDQISGAEQIPRRGRLPTWPLSHAQPTQTIPRRWRSEGRTARTGRAP
jgi:hypothetical protein